MKKQQFKRIHLLLIFYTALIMTGCDGTIVHTRFKSYSSIGEVRQIYQENQRLFTKVAELLWRNGPFFEYLGSTKNYQKAIFSPEKVEYSGFFTEEEWNLVREIFLLTKPRCIEHVRGVGSPFSLSSCVSSAIKFEYLVQYPDDVTQWTTFSLYYLDTYGSNNTQEIQRNIDEQLAHWGQWQEILPLEEEKWYEGISYLDSRE